MIIIGSHACAALMDFASGDSVHGDFMHNLIVGVVDRARRRRWCYWAGRLGVMPDELPVPKTVPIASVEKVCTHCERALELMTC